MFSALLALALCQTQTPNSWQKVAEGQVGPRYSAPLVYLPAEKAFTLLGGYVSHEHKGPFPFDLLAFDSAKATWRNLFPDGGRDRGPEVGAVANPGFKTPYFELKDREGLPRLHPQQAQFYQQFAYAPWDGCVYALVCGHTLKYDPKTRAWADLNPANAPVPVENSFKPTLCWGALCADPMNQEMLLFGGCGASTDNGSPGTWVYATKDNTWRKLDLNAEPGPRAQAPMAYDARSQSIVLFGGDRLNQLLGDTWVYDCKTRTWSERKPAINPHPRFGHGLIAVPGQKGIVLVGGKTYTSSTSYQAMLYKTLPFEMWTFDLAQDRWSRLQTSGEPSQIANQGMMIASNDRDELLLFKQSQGKAPEETWAATIDLSRIDEAGAKASGVGPGASVFRTGPYDPAWYAEDVPAPDEKGVAKFLADVPANRFVDLEAPRWPTNRQGGGWSTAALDTDNDQILVTCGGHSSYFGNDMAHFNLKTGRWSISGRPEFALEFNYDLSGPGKLTFGGAPWSNHNYKTYAYDTFSKRVILVGSLTHFYDPLQREWKGKERFTTGPFVGSKYVTFACATPQGFYVWARFTPFGDKVGIFKLENQREWVEMKLTGDKLPGPIVDRGSVFAYDSKRDRFLLSTTANVKDGESMGQLWAVDRKTGAVTTLNPLGREAIVGPRFAREAVYIPTQDRFLFGALIASQDKLLTPIYDPEKNSWLLADMPGSDVINSGRKMPGGSVDLGLLYDARRDLVYAITCNLRPGTLRALRLDAASLR